MIIYAPNEYPAPQHYHELDYATDEPLSMSVRYHTVEGGRDRYTHLDQIINPVFRDRNDGALLLDVWSADRDRSHRQSSSSGGTIWRCAKREHSVVGAKKAWSAS